MNEGVDIYYTKSGDIDNHPYNLVDPIMGELYAGWTESGEWINYTVQVNKTDKYEMDRTASDAGGIALDLNGKKLITCFSTYDIIVLF